MLAQSIYNHSFFHNFTRYQRQNFTFKTFSGKIIYLQLSQPGILGHKWVGFKHHLQSDPFIVHPLSVILMYLILPIAFSRLV